MKKLAEMLCASLAVSAWGIAAGAQTGPLRWDAAAVEGMRDAKMGAPMAARALAIVNTCMYDAWAAYDERAVGTQLRGALRRLANERTATNKERAISYAAYRALADVLPVDTESVYKPLMHELGYDPNDNSTDIETPTGIGNVACAAVLEYRHHDGANQLGNMEQSGEWRVTSGEKDEERAPTSLGMAKVVVATREGAGVKPSATNRTEDAIGPYGDWSGYRPMNPPTGLPIHVLNSEEARHGSEDPPLHIRMTSDERTVDPDRWQPLVYTDATGNLVLQRFAGAQWCFVKPFAMSKGDEFRSMLNPAPQNTVHRSISNRPTN